MANPFRLPIESTPPTTPGAMVRTALGALAVLLLANLAAGPFLARATPNEGYRLVAEKWRLVEAQTAPVDWLLLGDSSCNQGLDPAGFRAAGLGTALNLCTIGDLLTQNDAWMLDSVMAHAGPPRRGVVLTHVYDMWHRAPNPSLLGKVPLPWGFWSRGAAAIPLRPEQQRRVLLARYAPLYEESASLATALRAGPGAWSPGPVTDAAGFKAEAEANPEAVAKDVRAHQAFVAKAHFKLSAANEAGLEALLTAAEAHGFDVYLVNSPLIEGLDADPAFTGYYADVVASLQAHVAGHPRAHLLLAAPMTFPAEQMVNADHLTVAGAARFTARVIDEIGRSAADGAGQPR